MADRTRRGGHNRIGAFTLIELLVVIAIIALLVGILLPSLAAAREAARVAKCMANARSVAQGVYTYNSTYKEVYPAHYLYASSNTGMDWDMADQQDSNPAALNGYIHWSAHLFDDSNPTGVATEAFSCPTITTKGGAPRANPGPNQKDWEPGQTSDAGATTPSDYPVDRQAPRIAYAGNAAIFPRNKFNVSSQRRNRFVKDSELEFPQQTIMATEYFFGGNWDPLTAPGASTATAIKSHRPITPFRGLSSIDVYAEPNSGGVARFRYPQVTELEQERTIASSQGVIDGGLGTILNAVGRHHKGKKDTYGGSANFAYADAHVEQQTVAETIAKRRWGTRFLSLTGDNRVQP